MKLKQCRCKIVISRIKLCDHVFLTLFTIIVNGSMSHREYMLLSRTTICNVDSILEITL